MTTEFNLSEEVGDIGIASYFHYKYKEIMTLHDKCPNINCGLKLEWSEE